MSREKYTYASDGLLSFLDSMVVGTAKLFGRHTSSYMTLATADDLYPTKKEYDENGKEIEQPVMHLIEEDGSFVSLVEVHGTMTISGENEYVDFVSKISDSLKQFLSRNGHSVQFVLYSDSPDLMRTQNRFRKMKIMAERTGVDFNIPIGQAINLVQKRTVETRMFIVFRTSSSVLPKQTAKEVSKKNKKELKNIPYGSKAMPGGLSIQEVKNVHESFVNRISDSMRSIDFYVEPLNAKKSLFEIRSMIDRRMTPADWKPVIPGDKYLAKINRNMTSDINSVLMPPLTGQLFPRKPKIYPSTVEIGDTVFAPILVDKIPTFGSDFNELVEEINLNPIPFRISIKLEGDGIGLLNFKSSLASIFSFTSPQNRRIQESLGYLSKIYSGDEGVKKDVISGVTIHAATWAKVGDKTELSKRFYHLVQCLQGWGDAGVCDIVPNSMKALTNTIPGLNSKPVSVRTGVPIDYASSLLPMGDVASPWSEGSLIFMTNFKKAYPYTQYSRMQKAWITLVSGPMGTGKSVFLNALNWDLITSSIEGLPRIGGIDSGKSSFGLLNYIQEKLPKENKHLVNAFSMQNSIDASYNPFDTDLCCRHPTSYQKSFLARLLVHLVAGNDEKKGELISGLANSVIKITYERYSDNASPKTYEAGMNQDLDEHIEKAELEVIHGQTTYWKIVDQLFLKGDIHGATIAQRYAVPLLKEFSGAVMSEQIQDMYRDTQGKDVSFGNNESAVSFFSRKINESLERYPLFAAPTKFDIGDARIVFIDLQDVTGGSGAANTHRTGLMYMVARFIIGRDFRLNLDMLKEYPEISRSYHENKIKELMRLPKRLFVDEYHRTSGCPAFREEIEIDCREGRKSRLDIMLASQTLNDFNADIIKLSTSTFILGIGNDSPNEVVKTFDFPKSFENIFRKKLTRPGQFCASFTTKNGRFNSFLELPLSPFLFWMFLSDADERYVKTELSAKIGIDNAIRILSRFHQNGFTKEMIESYKDKASKGQNAHDLIVDDYEKRYVSLQNTAH